jgi:hypothetical protein
LRFKTYSHAVTGAEKKYRTNEKIRAYTATKHAINR